MVRRNTLSGVIAAVVPLALVAAVAAPGTARAAEKDKGNKKACAAPYASYKSAVEKEKAGLYSEARALFSQCAADEACPGLVPKCAAARDRVEGRMPTIVPVVTDETGALTDVVVKIDGETVASKLDGRALPVEVGSHELTCSTSKGAVVTRKILVVEGSKDKEIDLYVGAAHPAAAPAAVDSPAKPDTAASANTDAPAADGADQGAAKPASPAPVESANFTMVTTRSEWAMPTSPAPYILGGIGLASVAAGTLLTIWGNQDNSQLSQCSPACPRSSVEHIRTLYMGADVAWGVSAATLGLTTVLIAISRKTEKTGAPPVSVGFAPSPSGGMASVGGSF